MTNNQLFAAALGITAPWFVQTVDFDAGQRRLTIHVDFAPGSRFTHPKAPGEHPVHDTRSSGYATSTSSSMNAISKCACPAFGCRTAKWRSSSPIG